MIVVYVCTTTTSGRDGDERRASRNWHHTHHDVSGLKQKPTGIRLLSSASDTLRITRRWLVAEVEAQPSPYEAPLHHDRATLIGDGPDRGAGVASSAPLVSERWAIRRAKARYTVLCMIGDDEWMPREAAGVQGRSLLGGRRLSGSTQRLNAAAITSRLCRKREVMTRILAFSFPLSGRTHRSLFLPLKSTPFDGSGRRGCHRVVMTFWSPMQAAAFQNANSGGKDYCSGCI